jgi:iron complex outermembrane receptor protein
MKKIFQGGAGLLAVTCGLSATPAMAQRTDDNAVTEAEDAFGKSVGDERIGIYNPDDVRGFSPVAAGNVRIEGMYFDQQAFVTDRLLDGSTVHVGIAAQGYPFPAPTGIADYDLRKPGAKRVVSLGMTLGPFGTKTAEVDAQIPLDGERLGMTVGAGIYREQGPTGSSPDIESYAASLRFAPSANFTVQPFVSMVRVTDEESQPLIFTNGDFLPNRVPRGEFLGQKWADFKAQVYNYGVVSKAKLGGFDLGFGLFRSQIGVTEDHVDLLFDTDRSGGVGKRVVVSDHGNAFGSTSGELRLSRSMTEGKRRHTLHASVKARSLDRTYGGSVLIDLGPSRIGVVDARPQVNTVSGPKTRDRVRQKTYGLGYELRWAKFAELGLGIQKTDYSKLVTEPTGPLPKSNDSPWLFSATGAIHLGDDVALYGGFVRGLEESDVAPANAVNNNEAPPAIRTRQHDFGVRWKIRPGFTAVIGYFNVDKPYYNLDAANRFRNLGDIRNKGVEVSLSGKLTPNLTVVTGGLWLDSRVSGEDVDLGLVGKRPVGSMRLRSTTNVNWTLPWHKALTLTARAESASKRTANRANSFVVPARAVLNLGARYKFKAGGASMLVRGGVDNVFNKFGWHVGGGGFFVTNAPRRYSVSLAVDL